MYLGNTNGTYCIFLFFFFFGGRHKDRRMDLGEKVIECDQGALSEIPA